MESLPIEILETILSRLPSVSTLQCKRVCKTWRTVIGSKGKFGMLYALRQRNQREVQLYYEDRILYHRSKVNLEKYDSCATLTYGLDFREEVSLQNSVCNSPIVGSCNGLVCYFSQYALVGYPAFIICNPVTGEYVFLPSTTHRRSQETQGGFGYIQYTDEYMVVRIDYDQYYPKKTYAHVYTLGSQVGWRIINDEIPYIFNTAGIFANGAIHWLDCTAGECKLKIVAFDLADEKFKSVQSPPWEYGTNAVGVYPGLALLGGNLCVVFRRAGNIDIWAFKKTISNKRVTLQFNKTNSGHPTDVGEEYYDRSWSWNKEFSIACEPARWYYPFAITEGNEVLLWSQDTINSQSIYCYDPNTSTLNNSSDAYRDTYGSCFYLTPHMNTLVSLKDLGEC